MFLYFACGSNMLTQRLQARCPSARPVALAAVEDHGLSFDKMGMDGSGKATLVGRAGSRQWGVLFEIADIERDALDAAEGKDYARHDDLPVTRQDNGQICAVSTYVATARDNRLKPFDWYLALVIAGAMQHSFPVQAVAALRAVEFVVDGDTARHGRSNALHALAAAGIEDIDGLLTGLQTR